MMLKKSIDKTKNFFQRTLQNLKSFLFGRYKQLPKASTCNPFSCSSRNLKNHQLDHFYTNFSSDGWESDQDKVKKSIMSSSKEPMKEEDATNGSFMKFEKRNPGKIKQEEGRKEEIIGKFHDRRKELACSQSANEGGYLFAQQMKELEMMDVGNVDHVLDVEEVLHYYSRLRSPVYLDIVDKFFTDMYSECSHPQASVSINNSKRRLGPVKL